MGMNPGRRRPCTAPAVERLRTGIAPSPAAFRDLEACLLELSRGPDAEERNGRRQFSKAVSLQIEPELVPALRQALALASGIKAAFVHGSIAKGEQSPASEIELMVIVDATYAGCFGGLHDGEYLLKRRIRANFVSEQEWRRELRKINAQPRIVIFASVDDLLG
jgi:predicted nucleotidyltransferase